MITAVRSEELHVPGASAFEIEAILDQRSGDFTLLFEVKNIADRPMQVDSFDLPWNGARNLKLYLINAEKDHLENALIPIIDPITGTTSIKAGRSVSGKLTLSRYFPKLGTQSSEEKFLLCWSFSLAATGTPGTSDTMVGVIAIGPW